MNAPSDWKILLHAAMALKEMQGNPVSEIGMKNKSMKMEHPNLAVNASSSDAMANAKSFSETTTETASASSADLADGFVSTAQKNNIAAKPGDSHLLDERALLASIARTIGSGGRIRISSTLPNRLAKMLAPLHWHDYKKKYGKLDDFVASHPEVHYRGPYSSECVDHPSQFAPVQSQNMNGGFFHVAGGTSNVKILSKAKDHLEMNGSETRLGRSALLPVGNGTKSDKTDFPQSKGVSHGRPGVGSVGKQHSRAIGAASRSVLGLAGSADTQIIGIKSSKEPKIVTGWRQ
ncbi:UNVERIFIED_CONTAM: hypothetical protein Scaly_0534900 [Sesamum calycinum]|uniref:DUF7725 domain-containing protein n=1 Tax=Sesamum calycinum TaxID=2727403 RepID=A0AAW2RQM8_9LAMI